MAQANAARVAASAIASFIKDAMLAVGAPDADAAKVAELMVEADLTGADAHGVFRLPQYVRRIKAGGVNPKANISVTKTAPATAMIDGDNGMGHLVMQRAADTAVALAKEIGVAWVGARRSNHAGAAGVYAAMTLPHDMIGIYAVVANANHMPVWGGAENLLGTNPIAVAVPAGQEAPVVLDIATTVVSYGTVKAYKLQHKPMPEGWMVDARDGKPLTDSDRSAEGLLLPIGGHKGSGLALVLGLLAGTLNGAAFGRDVVDFNADDESACDTGHFIIALDVSRFIPIAAFKSEIDR
jgi:L-2-hydroxycarboxylate dehydrogenase (NAD+)